MVITGVSIPPGSYATFLQNELLGSSLQPLHSLQHVFRSEVLDQEKTSHNSLFVVDQHCSLLTRFKLADSIDDNGISEGHVDQKA